VIARVLEEAEDHLDIDQITERARRTDPSVHRATVYRTIATFKKIGLVDELDLLHIRGDRHYYEIRTGSEHAHVICTTCGAVVEPPGGTISSARDGFARETGFDVDYIRVEVGGTCPECRHRSRVRASH
jgi:Fur family ferric uptake transcriptional regulator